MFAIQLFLKRFDHPLLVLSGLESSVPSASVLCISENTLQAFNKTTSRLALYDVFVWGQWKISMEHEMSNFHLSM